MCEIDLTPCACMRLCALMHAPLPISIAICMKWICQNWNWCDGHATKALSSDSITLPHPTGDVVPAERCPGDPPPLQKPCEMPCPDDCVLDEWSSWSSCSYCCSSKQVQGKQTRSRVILAPSGERKAFLPLSKHITNTTAGRNSS